MTVVFWRWLLLAGLVLGIAVHGLHAQSPALPVAASPAAGATPALGDDTDQEPAPGSGNGNLFPGSGPAVDQQVLRNRPRPSRLLGNKAARNARAGDLIASEADADPLEVRIAYRRAKTAAIEQDPGMNDLLLRADAAPTDKAKREYLRQYYARLFTAVQKIDPSPALSAHLALLKILARQRYNPQRRQIAGEENLINGRRGGR